MCDFGTDYTCTEYAAAAERPDTVYQTDSTVGRILRLVADYVSYCGAVHDAGPAGNGYAAQAFRYQSLTLHRECAEWAAQAHGYLQRGLTRDAVAAARMAQDYARYSQALQARYAVAVATDWSELVALHTM